MSEFFVSVGGKHCTRLDLFVPQYGAWFIDAVLDDTTDELSGPVVVQIGTLQLQGTAVPSYSGSFALARSLRIVGGANGWGTQCEPQDYASDGGVDAEAVARDVTAVAGETLGTFDPVEPILEDHFTRRASTASSVLEKVLGPGRHWWIDAQGVTQTGVRGTTNPPAGSYNLLTYSPLTRNAELAVDDPVNLWVGSVLTDRLSEPQTIREMRLHVSVDASGVGSCRVYAWTGGDESTQSRVGRALDALLEQRESKRLYGTYRYRVVAVGDDKRLQLQAVRPLPGLPDVLPVSPGAGLPGAVCTPTEGSIVRVAFDEGDCEMPYVAQWPAGDPEKAAGIARMSDMVICGGAGYTIMLSLGPLEGGFTAPTGTLTTGVPGVQAGVPYLMTFCDVGTLALDPTKLIPPTPADPLTQDPLDGYILSGSDLGAIE